MTSLTKLIFVNENENIFEACAKQGVVANIEHLKFISAKANNNYIGYYQFLQDEVYYKIYILPKTTPRVENDDERNKRAFIELLSKYYQLKSQYSSIKYESRNRNIVDFALESEKESNRSDKFDDFITYKYSDALQTIEQFFKKHKNSLVKEKRFYAQSVRQQFDLKRNILELDKSKIHQRKKEPYLYSKLAIISVEVLHHFLKHKGKNREAKKLKNRIEAKYGVDSYNFKPKEIGSKKVLKLFKSSDEKELYLALLSLLGIESYFEDNSYKAMLKLHNQHAHFFRPEDLYEWRVYDELVKKYGQEAVSMKSTYHYYIADKKRNAEPDFVVTDGEEIIVIDAKWKILDSKTKISFDDVVKLWRDRLLTEATKAVLIYPQIDFEKKHHVMMIKDEAFEFETRIVEL
jgi:hypothetical protein